MLLVASSKQTVRIRHADKGSLCRRMSNALTDESETRLSSSLYSLAHFHSIALFPSLHLFPLSFSLSLSLLSLSFRGCQSVFPLCPPSLCLFPSFFFLLSDILSLSLSVNLSISCHLLLTCYPCQSLSMYILLSEFKFTFLARTLLGTELQDHTVQLLHYEYNNS